MRALGSGLETLKLLRFGSPGLSGGRGPRDKDRKAEAVFDLPGATGVAGTGKHRMDGAKRGKGRRRRRKGDRGSDGLVAGSGLDSGLYTGRSDYSGYDSGLHTARGGDESGMYTARSGDNSGLSTARGGYSEFTSYDPSRQQSAWGSRSQSLGNSVAPTPLHAMSRQESRGVSRRAA